VPDFVFATCLPGVEPAVKLEIARTRPELRFAYSRPGFVTFRAPGPIAAEDPSGSVFARVWGRSIGAARSPEDAAQQLAALGVDRVHVFAREPATGETLFDRAAKSSSFRAVRSIDAGASAIQNQTRSRISMTDVSEETWRAELDLTAWQAIGPGGPALDGELVADVILAPEDGEQEVSAWLGVHRHRDATHAPHAGGAPAVAMPPESPSRAYSKIEEAIAWARLPVAAGDTAVEIGAAPGGAVLALARRGLDVWGVDTGDLASQVAALPNVHHLAKKVGALRWEELPERVEWLLVDMNLAPQVVLHEIARLMPKLRPTLRGAVLTLKLNDWAFVDELPQFAARIAEMGLPRVAMKHLPSNRREVCAVALP
jgi:23S rRNA (cytidine2498-2'-O)-methyltransferase